jgi:hypothetical protein
MPLQNPSRPPEVKLLVLIILWLTLWNFLRLIQAIRFWDILAQYRPHAGPLYLALSGGIWALIGLVIALVVWQGKFWAWSVTLGAMIIYGAWIGFDRFIIQSSHGNELFTLILTVTLLIFILLLLSLKNVRDFYHDR